MENFHSLSPEILNLIVSWSVKGSRVFAFYYVWPSQDMLCWILFPAQPLCRHITDLVSLSIHQMGKMIHVIVESEACLFPYSDYCIGSVIKYGNLCKIA